MKWFFFSSSSFSCYNPPPPRVRPRAQPHRLSFFPRKNIEMWHLVSGWRASEKKSKIFFWVSIMKCSFFSSSSLSYYNLPPPSPARTRTRARARPHRLSFFQRKNLEMWHLVSGRRTSEKNSTIFSCEGSSRFHYVRPFVRSLVTLFWHECIHAHSSTYLRVFFRILKCGT